MERALRDDVRRDGDAAGRRNLGERLGGGDSAREPRGGDSRVATGSGLAMFAAALGLCAAGGVIASWSHVCPWGTEIRIAAPAVANGALRATLREAA